MTIISELFSVVFVLSAGISFVVGAYILRIERNAHENLLFFAASVALTFWALGLGLALSAPSEVICLFWRRIAAMGWGTFFSLLLHFTLALTGRITLKNKHWVYALLYAPVILNLLVFAIPTGINPTPFVMVNTYWGWTNVAKNTAWDIYYMVYYLGSIAAAIFLVGRWGVKSVDSITKKQTKLLMTTFITATVLGTLTDMVANSLLHVRLPQMAPVFILIPMMAIFFSIKRYGFLHHSQIKSNDEILSDKTRKKLYRYITIALVAGGALTFLTQYVMNTNGDLGKTVTISGAFLLAGAGINIVNCLKLSARRKDIINSLGLSLSIPIFILSYLQYDSVTVWAFPFILIIVSLVFNKRIVLRVVAFLTLLTQVIVWILAPPTMIVMNDSSFALRIGMFIIAIALAFFVNKVYIGRLKQNADQVSLQTLVSEISTEFVTANQDNIEEKIEMLLAKTAEFFDTDRAYACFFNKKSGVMHCSCSLPRKIQNIDMQNTKKRRQFTIL